MYRLPLRTPAGACYPTATPPSTWMIQKNMTVVDFNELCNLEPACIGIYDLPIGSDIQLVVEPDRRRRWFDNKTEKEISFR